MIINYLRFKQNYFCPNHIGLQNWPFLDNEKIENTDIKPFQAAQSVNKNCSKDRYPLGWPEF